MTPLAMTGGGEAERSAGAGKGRGRRGRGGGGGGGGGGAGTVWEDREGRGLAKKSMNLSMIKLQEALRRE